MDLRLRKILGVLLAIAVALSGCGTSGSRGIVQGLYQSPVPKQNTAAVLATNPRDSGAFTTTRAIIASQSGLPNNGTSSWAVSKAYCCRKTVIAGGKWKALKFIYCNFYSGTPPGGGAVVEMSNRLTPVEITATLEMVNPASITSATSGIASRTVSWENDSGALFNLTFNGVSSGLLAPGDFLESDWVYPSDVGLSVFEFTNREQCPFVRSAFQHQDGVTNMVLPWMGTGQYGFPMRVRGNAGTASNAGTTYADFVLDARRSGRTTGKTPNGTLAMEFGPVMVVGIPADGQKALVAMGTSTPAGQGDGGYTFDWANTLNDTTRNHVMDMGGLFGRACTDDNTAVPFLQMSVGGTGIMPTWGESKTTGSVTMMDQRASHPKLLRYADVLVIGHDINDAATSSTDFDRCYKRLIRYAKSQNPNLKTYWLERCTTATNNSSNTAAPTEAGSTGTEIAKYTNLAALQAAGWIDGKVSIRSAVGATGPLAPFGFLCDSVSSVESGTVTSGTTTSLTDASKTWVGGRYTNAWVEITISGVPTVRKISGHGGAWNTQKTTLQWSTALAAAPSAGDTYRILKCVQTDNLHMNAVGHTLAGEAIKTFLAGQRFPFFNRP